MANTAFTHDPTITVPSSTVNNRVVTWNGTTGKVFNNTATVTIAAGVVAGVTALTVDDITVDGTSITTIASNNNINITPHGTGSVVLSKVDINGGAIDGTAIGAASASTAVVTSVTAPTAVLTNSTNSNAITLNTGATAANYTITLPVAVPGAAGKVLKSSGSSPYSTLEWGTPATSTSHQVLRKTLDESKTDSTLENDADFTFAIGANEIWVVQLYLFITGADTGGLKHNWTLPSGSFAFGDITWIQHNAGGAVSSSSGKETSTGVIHDASSSTVVKGAIVTAILKNGSSAGTANWQWAQSSTNSTPTTIQADSTMIAHKV